MRDAAGKWIDALFHCAMVLGMITATLFVTAIIALVEHFGTHTTQPIAAIVAGIPSLIVFGILVIGHRRHHRVHKRAA